MTRLLVDPAALDRAAEGAGLPIAGDDHHYLARVLRLEVGAALELIDGAGRRAPAVIAHIEAERVIARLTAAPEQISRSGPRLVSVLALIKGERMDWAIAKLVELGVDRIVLARCERCVVQVAGDRAAKRRARYLRLAGAAARQCGRADLPAIDPIADLAAALAAVADVDARVVLSPRSERGLDAALPPEPQAIALATGPEGGFTAAELELATARGFVEARLGPRILRAETAAIAALTAASALRGDLR